MTKKIYLENPYLRQIDARILEKEYMNNKYYIKTNKTIFYPNLAGGQPGDIGTINGVKVIDTYEDGEEIIHVVEENIHSDRVQLAIDWDNRFDYMQQHSGQHLLSSVFYKLYNGETLGFYIGKNNVYVDIDIEEISQKEIKRIEQFANKIVFSNFKIKTYIIEKDKTRIVEIDGLDFSTCCGTHLGNTGEIGMIKIKNVEPYKGNTRVEFACGNRALKDYAWKNKDISNMANLLSVEEENVYKKVEELYLENKALKEKKK